ncbi:MAG: transcription termination factor NusA [Victivallaceae bacterium]|nr:transcription termination factor NusA [Victivallaceae bacterium]
MNNELLTILEYIEKERGISRDSLIKALESAILSASRKSIYPANDLRVEIDPRSGNIRAWAKLEVVQADPNCDQIMLGRAQTQCPEAKVGDVIDFEVTPSNFGRIAAQTARQAIIQQLRRAEKENVQEEFADRVGQIINGTVRRFDAGNIIIDFQKAEGIMPVREKVHGEQYMPGDRINALLLKVDINSAGPSLIVSRASSDFVVKLFEREVTEIHDGIVKIMGVAREAGSRTKVAVASSDPRVDPVGACVGMRGSRVRSINAELGGERIDIIPYDADIRKYAANALLPAKVQSVEVNEVKHELVVSVSEEQSKLAFGKKAQNVRLSGRLLGWNVNIKSEAPAPVPAAAKSIGEQIEEAAGALADSFGVSLDTARLLIGNGYVTTDGIREAGRDALLGIDGISADEINAAFDRLEK